MNQASAIELVVAKLERQLSEKAHVAFNVRLPDRTTGRKRQVDVLVTMKDGYREMRIMYEVKHHARPIDVPDLEALATKRDHLGLDGAATVSTSGYTAACYAKAEALGIRLMTLKQEQLLEVARVQIAPGATVHYRQFEVTGLNVLTLPEQDAAWEIAMHGVGASVDSSKMLVESPEGARQTLKELVDRTGAVLVAPGQEPFIDRAETVQLELPGHKLRMDGREHAVPITGMEITFRLYEEVGTLEPATERVYRLGGKPLGNVLTTSAKVGSTEFHIQLLGKIQPDGTLAVSPQIGSVKVEDKAREREP